MLQFSKAQIAGVVGLVLLGLAFAVPNLLSEETRNSLPGFLPRTTINLGLDLQGGSSLLLGVKTDKVIDDRMKSLMTDIRREMRPNRASNKERISIANLVYNAETSTVTLRVRDESDADEAEDRVRDITKPGIGSTFGLGTRPYIVSRDGPRIDIAMTSDAQIYYSSEAVRDSIEVVRRRIDPAGNKEVSIAPQGENRIVVQVPGDNDPEALKAIINRTGQLSFHRQDPTVDPSGPMPPGRMLVPFAEFEGSGAPPIVLHEEAEVTGDMVNNAWASPNSETGGFQINFEFDTRGARRFSDYTRNNIGAVFAIILDNEVISAPTIQSAITTGSGRITGNFTAAEASQTALLIRSGALPAELTTLDQRTIDPTLGADSVKAGAEALLLGFVLVIIYMVVSYGRFGIYADIALIANVILIAGALSLMGSTLTLPGIAGIVLTIGMAVDANVLIFERIREESRAGRSVISAIDAGYSRALGTILDANITTLIAAVILFQLGSGPVRGFAVTLAIGIFTTVFSAFTFSRLLVALWIRRRRPSKLPI